MKEDAIITQDPDLLEIFVETSPNPNLVNIYMVAFKLKHVYALENVLHVASMQSHTEAKSCSHLKDRDLKKPTKNQKEKACYTQKAHKRNGTGILFKW